MLETINSSIDEDQRMYKEDIEGSRAHVRMLERVGLISESDKEKILDALDQTEKEIEISQEHLRESLTSQQDNTSNLKVIELLSEFKNLLLEGVIAF